MQNILTNNILLSINKTHLQVDVIFCLFNIILYATGFANTKYINRYVIFVISDVQIDTFSLYIIIYVISIRAYCIWIYNRGYVYNGLYLVKILINICEQTYVIYDVHYTLFIAIILRSANNKILNAWENFVSCLTNFGLYT